MASAAVMRGVESEIRDLIRHAEKSGWEVTRKSAKLRFTGPDGAGPVFIPIRTSNGRDLSNRVHDLIRAGLAIGDHTAENIDGPTPVIVEKLLPPEPVSVPGPWLDNVIKMPERPTPAIFADGTLVPTATLVTEGAPDEWPAFAEQFADVETPPADPMAEAFTQFNQELVAAIANLRDAFGRLATAASESTEWQALAEMAEARANTAEAELATMREQREAMRRFLGEA